MTTLHKAASQPTCIFTVHVALAGATAINAKYINRPFIPSVAVIQYNLVWDAWNNYGLTFSGSNVRKDGSIGMNVHKWEWSKFDGGTWEEMSQPQRWAEMLFNAYRPEGFPILDPARQEVADLALLHPEVRP